MTRTGFFRADKATQLAAFLADDPIARKHFPILYHDSILKHAKRLMKSYGNDLDEGLVEDAVQCFWLSLLKSKPSVFRIAKGTADGFIESRLKTAIRDVRATYTPPGQPTRLPKKGSEKAKSLLPCVVSFDAPLPGSENSETLADTFADPVNRITEATNHISVVEMLEYIQATTPSNIFKALALMTADDISLSKAAQTVGIHHTSFRRGLNEWASAHEKHFLSCI